MLSSISNSNERLPRKPYLWTWLTAAALCVVMLAGWEGFWRARGFAPMPNDDAGWWSRERAKADRVGPDSVVLVGSSRMQLGFDPAVFTQVTGRRTIQLAIDGDPGIEVLRDLATDPNFHGSVICELMEKYLVGIANPATPSTASEWLHEYYSSNIFDRFERRARALTQTSFAFRLPDLSAQNLAANLRQGKLPPPPFVKMGLDRSKQADYTQTDLVALRSKHEAIVYNEYAHLPGIGANEFVERGRQLAASAAQIEARGGRVIFVRFPTSGPIRAWEDSRFPPPVYWDAMVAQDRLTALNFADYDELRNFTCADGTHLDHRDAVKFTAALAQIMLEKDLLPAAGP